MRRIGLIPKCVYWDAYECLDLPKTEDTKERGFDMNGMSIPFVRLEVEGMKHSILCALSEYAEKMDKDIRSAVEIACDPENVKCIIAQAVAKEMKSAIDSEIRAFFSGGAGREAIRDAVDAKLTREIKYVKEEKRLAHKRDKKVKKG